MGMMNGIQTFLAEAGEAACYALCLLKIAEEETKRDLNVTDALLAGCDMGYIHYNRQNPEDNDNFYVKDPCSFLRELTGKKWTIRKISDPNYKARDNEYTVQRWERQVTGRTITHFRRPAWDSLFKSMTVERGRLAQLYIFTVAR